MTQSTRLLTEQFKALESIQELDLKIDQLKKNQGALPESLRVMEQALAKVGQSIAQKNHAIAEAEKVQRQTQAARELNNDRLARSESRLVAVQNSQEYQAVNKETEQLKKLAISLEEQFKKAEADMEPLKKALGELIAQQEKLKGERDAQANLLSSQSGKFETEITTLTKERAQYTSQVDKPLLAQYDRVRGARQGLGFVPAIAGRCKGCNMMVPPQMFNEIRKRNAVHACPSCHRILFVPAESS
ncbi:MAG: C4-type zinc ribbon domain-containing protein [Oligoflexia bacterium]|nr:C4-type zinc ribbon domain-containing protein [Oligoflexia bacterium]